MSDRRDKYEKRQLTGDHRPQQQVVHQVLWSYIVSCVTTCRQLARCYCVQTYRTDHQFHSLSGPIVSRNRCCSALHLESSFTQCTSLSATYCFLFVLMVCLFCPQWIAPGSDNVRVWCWFLPGCEVGERPVRHINGSQDRRTRLRAAGRHRGSQNQDGDDCLRLPHDPWPSAPVTDWLSAVGRWQGRLKVTSIFAQRSYGYMRECFEGERKDYTVASGMIYD